MRIPIALRLAANPILHNGEDAKSVIVACPRLPMTVYISMSSAIKGKMARYLDLISILA